ncbi:hypothetical protein DFJ68_1155 [Terracoccus luteus]|jgi:hypothetical protein|uniref:Homing endonuclease LAGLIDADG domain-containing protein n=1 Tax=Terracoccus luteus TaxID=53356 RepID=A0A495Y1A2_9MICO|nr:LAGLIDADG family homing endonuclease [Terracoccus luteus]RKT77728.1 hypothetical protein DFJ68_1155 [Terracoccus luteus]
MLLDPQVPAISYLLGLLQTDGSHHGSLDGKGKVSIELAVRDLAVLQALQPHVPCYSSLRLRTRETNFSSASSTATLAFFNQSVRRELSTLGLPPGRKARTTAPVDQSLVSSRDYLRGLLDGDGSVGITARGYPFVSFITASEAMARHVESEIERVTGARRRCGRNTRDAVFNVMVANEPAAMLAAYCWSEQDISIPRKRASASQVAGWRPPPGRRFGAPRKLWTDAEDAVLHSGSVESVARLLNRTERSVAMRRWRAARALPTVDTGPSPETDYDQMT